MLTKEVTINGKKYQGNFNASKELSQSIAGLKDEVLIGMPRVRTWNGFRPVVKLGEDEVILGFHFYTEAEKLAYKEYDKQHRGAGTGSTGVKKTDLTKYAKEILSNDKLVKTLSPECVAFLKSATEDPEMTKMLQKLVAMGKSEEEARAFLGI